MNQRELKILYEALVTDPPRRTFLDGLEPDEFGLVYLGGELCAETVLAAYARGCFPWTGSDPVPWYSPDPRLVLYPGSFRISRSLRKVRDRRIYVVRFDFDFEAVMRSCAGVKREGQNGTWITENMIDVYTDLHCAGAAHCVGVYRDGILRGGLYGLSLGRAFFGESMFSLEPDTSKLALWALCDYLEKKGFDFIDCQQVSPHLMSLGAVPISRTEYLVALKKALGRGGRFGSWGGFGTVSVEFTGETSS